jgi:hypothetical protein
MDSKQKKGLLNRTAPREEKLRGRTGKMDSKQKKDLLNGTAPREEIVALKSGFFDREIGGVLNLAIKTAKMIGNMQIYR